MLSQSVDHGRVVDVAGLGSLVIDAVQVEQPEELEGLGVQALVAGLDRSQLVGGQLDADSVEEVVVERAVDERAALETPYDDCRRPERVAPRHEPLVVVMEVAAVAGHHPLGQGPDAARLHLLLVLADQPLVLPTEIDHRPDVAADCSRQLSQPPDRVVGQSEEGLVGEEHPVGVGVGDLLQQAPAEPATEPPRVGPAHPTPRARADQVFVGLGEHAEAGVAGAPGRARVERAVRGEDVAIGREPVLER